MRSDAERKEAVVTADGGITGSWQHRRDEGEGR